MNNWSTSQELRKQPYTSVLESQVECQLCLSQVSCLSRGLHIYAQFSRETIMDASIRILNCRICWPRNSVVFKKMTNIRYDSGLQQQYKKSNFDYLGH